ncbi:SusC/RagA family TonB-linked outer membrane protein [Saccharicrinis fermentans]|uniref:Outer membrane cobalamin receptor protein n=1 Tax=Saccharicrinis fermentans DSM 9555 = JCM 21142 TaxID=869213 RepID=W7YE78_9BACT|nr:SusC/RagA family TonB-linked outer membrane protein [Saccharicrinis fermentans]GAF02766.1 outer membrane cobalamin receptor protein [Saccharicrinis fermentans DSM 9555 = JCM 21142]
MKKENLNRMRFQCGKWLLLLVFGLFCTGAFAQQRTVTGTVTGAEDGYPIPGVSVVIKGTTIGTITDLDGKYSIKAENGNVLVFSFIGMTTSEVQVSSSVHDLKMKTDLVSLEEVVAIGYGTQKKKEVTGAVVQVKSEALEKISTSDLGSALQGAIAGVSVQASSGAPGSSSNIQIRGISSINGQNDPLWVVDGIPQEGDPGLSSSEIESIDVLKDAASCAIYGTRGAAGVILVTTKKGKAGEMKISANGYYGVQEITSGIDLLDFEEYFQTHFYNKVHLDPTTNSDLIWTSLEQGADNFTNNTNIVDVIENDHAKTQNYSVNISGGTKDLTYNVVGSFFEQEGSLLNTNYERFNVRANSSYKKGKWTIRTGLGFKVDEQKYAAWNLLYEAYKYKPYQAPLDPDASTFDDGGQENDKLQLGTVMAKLKQTDTRNGESFNGNVNVNLEILKGLNFTTRIGVVYGNNTRVVINPLFEVYDEEGELVVNSNTRSGIKNTSDRNTNFTWEGGVNYGKRFGDHSLKFLANMSVEKFDYTSFWASGKDLTSNEVPNLGQTTADYSVGIGSDWTQDKTNKIMGVLGRVQYNYKDGRYNLSVSARRDGSSRFASGNQWKTFPSAAVSWNVADENFFQGLTSTINSFKVRASYGTTGNQSILDYSYAPTISSGYDYASGVEETTSLALGSIQTGYANPEVQWETSIQKNLGFDLGFFSNKLTLNVDLYDTQKEDLLFPLLIPTAAGAGQNQDVVLNVGDMSNRGIEVAAGYRHHGKFSWGASATYTKNVNEVTKMAGSNPISYFSNGNPISVSGNNDKITVIREGYEAGALW